MKNTSMLLLAIGCGALSLCKSSEDDEKKRRAAEPVAYFLPHEEICPAGRFAVCSIQEKHGREGLLAYTRALVRLKKIDPKLDLCHREKTKELVVINSEHIKESDLEAALTPRQSELMYVHIKNSMPSGEKVLAFKDNPKEVERWETWLDGGEYFQRGHPIRESLFGDPSPYPCTKESTTHSKKEIIKRNICSWWHLPDEPFQRGHPIRESTCSFKEREKE